MNREITSHNRDVSRQLLAVWKGLDVATNTEAIIFEASKRNLLSYSHSISQVLLNLTIIPGQIMATSNSALSIVCEDNDALGLSFDAGVFDTSEVLGEAQVTSKPLITCKLCKSHDVAWTYRQTRSGDEGMKLFCRCNVCGANF